MNLKGIFKTTRAAIGALVFVFAGAAQAQIPVTDVASISTSVATTSSTSFGLTKSVMPKCSA